MHTVNMQLYDIFVTNDRFKTCIIIVGGYTAQTEWKNYREGNRILYCRPQSDDTSQNFEITLKILY